MEMDVEPVMMIAMIVSRDAWFGMRGLIAMKSLELGIG